MRPHGRKALSFRKDDHSVSFVGVVVDLSRIQPFFHNGTKDWLLL